MTPRQSLDIRLQILQPRPRYAAEGHEWHDEKSRTGSGWVSYWNQGLSPLSARASHVGGRGVLRKSGTARPASSLKTLALMIPNRNACVSSESLASEAWVPEANLRSSPEIRCQENLGSVCDLEKGSFSDMNGSRAQKGGGANLHWRQARKDDRSGSNPMAVRTVSMRHCQAVKI